MSTPVIRSLLDTDLYKLTMQHIVLRHYEGVWAEYRLINRGSHRFPARLCELLDEQIAAMADLRLSADECAYLKAACPALPHWYCDWLTTYRFDPRQVQTSWSDGRLSLAIGGPWWQTILWEVPLLATISELYYAGLRADYTLSPSERGLLCAQEGLPVIEFGTRRRWSYAVQRQSLAAMVGATRSVSGTQGGIIGTSNIDHARAFDLVPMGTYAHELVQYHGTRFGPAEADRQTMRCVLESMPNAAVYALSDTYTTPVFLQQFDRSLASQFAGVRLDSGDPIADTARCVAHYQSLGIDPTSKIFLPSDGLDLATMRSYAAYCRAFDLQFRFGVGTYLSNPAADPLQIVIKATAFGRGPETLVPAVKLSNDAGKRSGDPALVAFYCRQVGIS